MNESLRTGEQTATTEFLGAIERLTQSATQHKSILREQTYHKHRRPSPAAKIMQMIGISGNRTDPDIEQKHFRFGTPHIFTNEMYELPEGPREIIVVNNPTQPTPSSILLRVFDKGKERGNPVELTESPELMQQATSELSQLADYYEVIHK